MASGSGSFPDEHPQVVDSPHIAHTNRGVEPQRPRPPDMPEQYSNKYFEIRKAPPRPVPSSANKCKAETDEGEDEDEDEDEDDKEMIKVPL
ncbi:hypothetical protein PG984_013211 [Apiospora sp. TS-2023a]